MTLFFQWLLKTRGSSYYVSYITWDVAGLSVLRNLLVICNKEMNKKLQTEEIIERLKTNSKSVMLLHGRLRC